MALSFSVAIVAYKRKDYLIRAVDSVLNQDYPRELIQIIVVKAFHDENIDSYLLGNGVKNIFLDTSINGDLISGALKECSNEVICLLEDDDIFYHSKLKTISDVYEKHPEIDFAVNGYNIIDSEDNVVVNSSFHLIERKNQASQSLLIIDKNRHDSAAFKSLNFFFNVSRFTFRKNVAKKLINILVNVQSSIDDLVTMYCILSEYVIAFIPGLLNGYRIHGKNRSIPEKKPKSRASFLIGKNLMFKNSLTQFILNNKNNTELFLNIANFELSKADFEYSMMILDRSSILLSFKQYLEKGKNVNWDSSFYISYTLTKKTIIKKILLLPLFLVYPKLARFIYLRSYT
jgi:glycosyltransferase involved in cell wall biosynthesis